MSRSIACQYFHWTYNVTDFDISGSLLFVPIVHISYGSSSGSPYLGLNMWEFPWRGVHGIIDTSPVPAIIRSIDSGLKF